MAADPNTLIDFWQNIALAVTSVILTMVGFWFTFGRHMISKLEVVELISLHSPYLQDRQTIMNRLEDNKVMQQAFSSALQKNTEVMGELKIQIAVLGKTLDNLERRIEKDEEE